MYKIERLSQRSYAISEDYNSAHTVRMGLVVGDETAALIDTGTGIGNLTAVVREITSLPTHVYNTHWHMDHIGANGQFDRCYISHIDGKHWKAQQAQGKVCLKTKTQREQYIRDVTEHDENRMNMLLKSLNDDLPFQAAYIGEEDTINLGGIKLRPIYLPGHTAGSMVFINDEESIAFVGDAILMRVWLHIDPTTTVKAYYESLQRYQELTRGINRIIPAHQYDIFAENDVAELCICAQEILHGAQGVPFTRHGMQGQIHQYGSKYIVFSNDRIS